eukprot:UN01848
MYPQESQPAHSIPPWNCRTLYIQNNRFLTRCEACRLPKKTKSEKPSNSVPQVSSNSIPGQQVASPDYTAPPSSYTLPPIRFFLLFPVSSSVPGSSSGSFD